MSAAEKETCPICDRDLDCEESVVLQTKGAVGINRASIERGITVRIEAGSSVHKRCRVKHTCKKKTLLLCPTRRIVLGQ